MSYQFIHVSAYGRNAGAGKAGGHSVASIAAEAERQRGACPHIKKPEPPEILYGMSPTQAAEAAAKWAEEAKDSIGRKLRKDGLCLLAGVISLPRDLEKAWELYAIDSVRWLKKEYGDRLLSVVEHTDEPHPHLHFYVVPKKGERFSAVHDGYLAAEGLGYGTKKGERNKAYKEAMRDFQKRYFSEISQSYGLQHFGPGRQRLTRAEWKTRKIAAQEIAEIKEKEVKLDFRISDVLSSEERTVIKKRFDKLIEETREKTEALRQEKIKLANKKTEDQNQKKPKTHYHR